MPVQKSRSRLNAEQYYQQQVEATNRAMQAQFGAIPLIGGFAGRMAQGGLDTQRAMDAENYALEQARLQQARLDQLPQMVGGADALARMAGARPQDLTAAQRGAYGYNLAQQAQAGIDPNTTAATAASNPMLNPAIAAEMEGAGALDAVRIQTEAARQQNYLSQMDKRAQDAQRQYIEFQQAQMGRLKPVRDFSRARANMADIKTIVQNEGTLKYPNAAKASYTVMRGQMLNQLRTMFEAGAMQGKDFELFSGLLPDAETWAGQTQEYRLGLAKEWDYQFKNFIEDYMLLNGIEGSADDYAIPGRSFDDIVTSELPAGFEDVNAPQPDTADSPVSNFLQGMGF